MEYINKCFNLQKQNERKIKDKENKIDNFNYNKFNLRETNILFDQIYNYKENTLNLYNDLEIFQNYDGSKKCVFNILDKTNLKIGNYFLKTMLNEPYNNFKELKTHNNILKKLDEKYNKINELLLSIKEAENDILWLLNRNDQNDESTELYETLYFQTSFLKFMNDNELFLNIYYIYVLYILPFMNIIMPVGAYIIPFILLKLFNIPVDHSIYGEVFKSVLNIDQIIAPGNVSSMMKYAGVFFVILSYFQTTYFCYKDSCHIYKVSNIIHEKLNNIYKFVFASIELNKITNRIFNDNILQNPINDLDDELFTVEPFIFSNKGKILRVFKLLTGQRYIFNNIILNTGKIDAYISILTLKKKYNLCYPKFINSEKPELFIKDLYHPVVSNPIKNTLKIKNKNKHVLITGANACGKSTFIKSVSLNILLSQTIGVCFANKFSHTPFAYFNTYLNLADCLGKESLFQAEMNRMQTNLKIVKKHKLPVFLAIDEIFSSTNPDEATAGGYAICKAFAKNKNLITLITTHFRYLTNLEKEKCNFINYKFEGEILNNNNIKYNYKLLKGFSQQSFALKLLKNNGYDKSIIECAEEIIEKIK